MTTVHRALDIRIFEKEAVSLAQVGYDVTIVVGHSRDETLKGVRLKAIPASRNRFERMTRTAWRSYRAAVHQNASVYHFHDPELIPVGILLKLRGRRVIYDVHEDFRHDILHKQWVPKILRIPAAACTAAAEMLGGLVFDGIIAATPTIAAEFPFERTVTVRNYPRMDGADNIRSVPYASRKPVAVYVGGITAQRGIREMVRAVALLPESLGVRLALAGQFDPPSLQYELASIAGWEKVDFHGWRPADEIRNLLATSKVGLVVLHPTAGKLESLPIKLFEYMNAGIPVIASNFELWRDILERDACGSTVDPLNPCAIAEKMQWVFEHPAEAEEMGRRGAAAVRARYNWDIEKIELLELYARLIDGAGR